ncbi:MAG TPA: hypothetical protein VFB76_11915, partial [Candidatus Angelobacter sp.]|nr:hypothetical protein [Candidatus Angelobacter sp.]
DVEAPDLTIAKTHVGQFHRGQTGAQYLITVSNVGFGPTAGTVTVVDTLPVIGNPHNLVPTDISGTGWTCTLATLTCTRADALASGSSYPVITMTVNIPQDITNNFTNTATVSGGGDVNPTNNKASDPVSLGPPIVITPHFTSASVVAGGTAQFVFDLEDDDPTLGPVNLGCNGLPVGAICTFNPASTTQPASQVTMTVTTLNGASNVFTSQNFSGPNSRLYAVLTFPALGFVVMVFGGRKNKKNRKPRLRLAFAFAGLVTLMALVGCGGGGRPTTPGGTFSITVSAATATVQATTQVNLTVQ